MAPTNESAPLSKKRKIGHVGLSDDLLDEFACPISGRLPVDPVTAMDGRIYDRHGLMTWFDKHPGTTIKSPVTGEAMGKEVVTAYQVRNTLNSFVERGLLTGEAVDEWKAECKEVDAYDADLKHNIILAEQGDKDAMAAVGFAFREGTNGAAVNHARSIEWMRRAAQHGSVQGWASLGVAYVKGEGVRLNHVAGVMYLAHAASLGSEHGCVVLGFYLSKKNSLMDTDIEMARYWYKKSLDCQHKDAIDVSKKRRDDFFAEHGQE